MAEPLARRPHADAGLSLLLAIQGLTLFVAVPLTGPSQLGRTLLDVCHLSYAGVCVGLLSRHRGVRALLVATLVLVVAAPSLAARIGPELALGAVAQHELIAGAVFLFNASVTVIVARHVFAGGRVTAHRVRGAVLLYLNTAALFAIAYAFVEILHPGAFASANGGLAADVRAFNARFTYFSLTTITTTGYGDIVPVSPVARSLANLEAVIGQLFPATLLARLVALHLAHDGAGDADGPAG